MLQNRIVEIISDGAHISVNRGFLIVTKTDAGIREKTGQIAIDDIGALVIRGFGASLSVNICSKLAEKNVPIILCGANQSPDSVIWPVSGHFAQGLTMQAQAEAGRVLQKRLWAQIIRAKIENQAAVLKAFGFPADDLVAMASRVKSGDAENAEAQAARRYWPRLMGENFRRDRGAGGLNAALNYGYTVLRAATARAILAAGLHPSLSLHHQSRGDALRLADDLMEPFRPWIDHKVRQIGDQQSHDDFELSPEIKAELAGTLQLDFASVRGASPMQLCIDRMAGSLADVFMGEARQMELPRAPLPLEAVAAKA